MHTYFGLLAKIFSSSESESGGKSQIFVMSWSSDGFLLDIGYLALQKWLTRIIKVDFTYVNEMNGSPIFALIWGHWPYRVLVIDWSPFE